MRTDKLKGNTKRVKMPRGEQKSFSQLFQRILKAVLCLLHLSHKTRETKNLSRKIDEFFKKFLALCVRRKEKERGANSAANQLFSSLSL